MPLGVTRLSFAVVAAVLPLPILNQPAATAWVTGRVTDPVTHAPVGGAVVRVMESADSAVTDAAGRYRLPNAPRDVATLSVSGRGYLDLVIPRVPVRTDTLHFDVELHSNPPMTRRHPNGTMYTPPILLIRLTADSLGVIVDPDSSYFAKPRFTDSTVESVEVIKRTTRAAAQFGPSGTAGGLLRVVMKPARNYPFPDM